MAFLSPECVIATQSQYKNASSRSPRVFSSGPRDLAWNASASQSLRLKAFLGNKQKYQKHANHTGLVNRIAPAVAYRDATGKHSRTHALAKYADRSFEGMVLCTSGTNGNRKKRTPST